MPQLRALFATWRRYPPLRVAVSLALSIKPATEEPPISEAELDGFMALANEALGNHGRS